MMLVRHALRNISSNIPQVSQGSSVHMKLRSSAKRDALRSTLATYAYNGSFETTNKLKKRKILKVESPSSKLQSKDEEILATPNVNWNEMLLKIREMRATMKAEVDEDGSEVLHLVIRILTLLCASYTDFL